VVWQHLDPATLDPLAARRASKSVVIVSALGGLHGWDDPVPDYKLKMSARTMATGPLAKFWLPHLAGLLPEGPVIDLTALEQHAAVGRPDRADWIRVELIGPDGIRSGHAGKAAKGRLARRLLEIGVQVFDEPETPDGWVLRLS
jgi:cytoplasmic iron level regulating protein YaaA (DUF328/UPF0246 family)